MKRALLLAFSASLFAQRPDPGSTAWERKAEVARLQIQVGSDPGPAKLLRQPRPVYPPEARAAHVEGNVLIRLTIGKNGHPRLLEVVSGHPMLIQAAIDAVKQWVYEPRMLNGEPVEVKTTISVPFTLSQ
jgi:protein TonB